MPPGLHVVLGARGGAGNAIARALHEAGLPVRGVTRGDRADLPGGVGAVAADLATPDGARRAVEGAAVVYLAAQPPYHRWRAELPALVDGVVAAVADQGAKLVMVDNLYAYGPSAMPLTEATPERATDRKGAVRRAVAASILDAHRAGRIRATIGRASDYLGPRADNSTITALAIAPAAAGRPARWLGRLDAPHSVGYLPDLARAYVTLGTSAEADGRVWHLPHADPVTGAAFLALVAASLARPVRRGVVSPAMLRLAAPVHRISRELLGILPQWTAPFVIDDGAFRRAFGPVTLTPLDEAVRTSLAAYAARD
jgi:nucleoside-diphosphate-sugar epimerase